LDIKAPDAMTGGELGTNLWVFLDPGDIVDVDNLVPVEPDEVDRGLDVAESALTKDVELVKAEIFRLVHIEVRDGKTLGHHLQCGMVRERTLTDEDTAGVNGEIVRKIFHHCAIAKDVTGVGMVFVGRVRLINDEIDVSFGRSEEHTS